MSGFSNFLANAVLNSTLNGAAFPAISNVKFALFTADPTDAFSAGTEVSAGWYSRVIAGTYSAPSAGVSYNTLPKAFPAVTGAPVTVTHIGIIGTASAVDQLLYSHPLPAPVTMAIGGIYLVDSTGAAGDYTLSLV